MMFFKVRAVTVGVAFKSFMCIVGEIPLRSRSSRMQRVAGRSSARPSWPAKGTPESEASLSAMPFLRARP